MVRRFRSCVLVRIDGDHDDGCSSLRLGRLAILALAGGCSSGVPRRHHPAGQPTGGRLAHPAGERSLHRLCGRRHPRAGQAPGAGAASWDPAHRARLCAWNPGLALPGDRHAHPRRAVRLPHGRDEHRLDLPARHAHLPDAGFAGPDHGCRGSRQGAARPPGEHRCLDRRADRRGFQERAPDLLALPAGESEAHALALLDLDDFKRLNDRLGHATGDEALVQLARLIGGQARANDVVARLGGEEFVVLLPATGAGGAKAWAEQLRAVIEAELRAADGIAVTASIGVAAVPAGTPLESLYRLADAALYHAKDSGKNRVVLA
ncbi:GGDEF domain-containing protein [Silanimonas sp.]|uniref:GGDEF domain-containing protein n=1 Tax=Silanimonas sp. TaxID=1929290 RepID=UPI0037C5FA8D